MVQGGTGAASDDEPVLIGIDAGTTSIRSVAFDISGRKIAAASRPTPLQPKETGGEYDPDEIWDCVVAVLREVGDFLDGRPVAGIAVASFGESPVLIDESGKACAPSMAWFDRRTEPLVENVRSGLGSDRIFDMTGQAIQHFFTLLKLLWMRDHLPDAIDRAKRVLMMADWIAYRLSGEAATDPSLASRTLYYDLGERTWSGEALSLAGLDTSFAAPLRNSGEALGPILKSVAEETGLNGDPVIGVGGHDHVVGAMATGLSEPGVLVNSIGTAEALLLGCDRPLTDPEVLRRGYFQGAFAADRHMYFIAGGMFSAGGSMDWVRELVGNPPIEMLIEEAETEPAGCQGTTFLANIGGGAPPHPDPHAAGAFLGLSAQVSRSRLYRAVLEGVAVQSRVVLDGMLSIDGVDALEKVHLIGGPSRNRLFMDIKSSVIGRPITVVDEPEGTALGAALFGGIASGQYASLTDALSRLDRSQTVLQPGPQTATYRRLMETSFNCLHQAMMPVNRNINLFKADEQDQH